MPISATSKALLALLADSRFHSGTHLASAMGISRSAVWKHLQALDSLGLVFTAVSGKGYRLLQPLELLDASQIYQSLSSKASELIQDLELHDVMASTNSHLMVRAQQNAPSGLVCLAEYQSEGRGRRGKSWVSPYGHNIYLSLLWRYQLGPSVLAGLSLAIGVGVIRMLRQLGINDVGLKWPNDIYWRGRKLAGILIEVSGESSGPCHAVIGLGLNVYLPTDQGHAIDQAWVDLLNILGSTCPSRNFLVASLLNNLLPIIAAYERQTARAYLDEWRSYDCMLGLPAVISMGNHQLHGIVRGVNDEGLLLMEDEAGDLRQFASGEISLRSL